MIQLLFVVLVVEAAIVVLLMIKTPIRKIVTMGIDRLKRGRGPIMVKTVGATVFVVLVSSFYSMQKIQMRSTEVGTLTPTDQILWSRHLLEASLMGYCLFLSLVIDRLHHYIKELRGLKKSKETLMKQNKVLEDKITEELKLRDNKIEKLKRRVNQLETSIGTKSMEAGKAESEVMALKKQSESFFTEYDNLTIDNQSLHDQLQSIDQSLSNSNGKKYS